MFDKPYDEERFKDVKITTIFIVFCEACTLIVLLLSRPSWIWVPQGFLGAFSLAYAVNWLWLLEEKRDANREVINFCWVSIEEEVRQRANDLAFKVFIKKNIGTDQSRLLLKSITIALTMKVDMHLIDNLLNESIGEHVLKTIIIDDRTLPEERRNYPNGKYLILLFAGKEYFLKVVK